MKALLRTLFSPILNFFEHGDEPFQHKPMNRTILIVVSLMFSGLATAIVIFSPKDDIGFLLPVAVFYGVGLVGLVVGGLGSERAVAKIWGNK